MGVALEPEFILEPPDIPKELESHTPKRKLIEPVSATIHEKRRQEAQKLLKEKPRSLTYGVAECKPHPIGTVLMAVDNIAVKIIYGLMDILEKVFYRNVK